MLFVNIDCGNAVKTIYQTKSGIKTGDIWTYLDDHLGLKEENFYIIQNGRLVYNNDILQDGTATLRCKLVGGKGGFGSMLRAIGAQIEKTTNREACRDLSGRRLRDINEEKRLKAWIEKQPEREKEAEEKKKKKLEKLCAVPKHEFNDKTYEEQRSKMMEQICDAVEAGYKAAETEKTTENGTKRANENEEPVAKKKKKRMALLDEELELSLSELSDCSDEETTTVAKC